MWTRRDERGRGRQRDVSLRGGIAGSTGLGQVGGERRHVFKAGVFHGLQRSWCGGGGGDTGGSPAMRQEISEHETPQESRRV